MTPPVVLSLLLLLAAPAVAGETLPLNGDYNVCGPQHTYRADCGGRPIEWQGDYCGTGIFYLYLPESVKVGPYSLACLVRTLDEMGAQAEEVNECRQ